MKRHSHKVGDWISGDGWQSTYRVCKITSRTVWLWTYGQGLDRPMRRPYFSFAHPEILRKTGFIRYDHLLCALGHKTKHLKPFRRL